MTKIFETYVLRNGSLILAAQLTEENIEEMFKICRGIHPEYVARSESDEKLMESFEIDLGANTLWCELGDYIVSDMAGSHRPVPSEIFEAHIQGKMV